MKPSLIGLLATTLIACGNGGASSEPAATPTSAAGGGVQTTGNTTKGNSPSSAHAAGGSGAVPNAGSRVEAAQPPASPRTTPTLAVPPTPGPANTGDPCGACAPPPGRR